MAHLISRKYYDHSFNFYILDRLRPSSMAKTEADIACWMSFLPSHSEANGSYGHGTSVGFKTSL